MCDNDRGSGPPSAPCPSHIHTPFHRWTRLLLVRMYRHVWHGSARVEKTVTRQFLYSHLLPGEIEDPDRSLAFGDGLTDFRTGSV